MNSAVEYVKIYLARVFEIFQDDVMHVILRIRVPSLRARSQYTLAGKVGKEMLRGNGLLAGNFSKDRKRCRREITSVSRK